MMSFSLNSFIQQPRQVLVEAGLPPPYEDSHQEE
jgi:hypothetical protein